jgi:hypothetical protein
MASEEGKSSGDSYVFVRLDDDGTNVLLNGLKDVALEPYPWLKGRLVVADTGAEWRGLFAMG